MKINYKLGPKGIYKGCQGDEQLYFPYKDIPFTREELWHMTPEELKEICDMLMEDLAKSLKGINSLGDCLSFLSKF